MAIGEKLTSRSQLSGRDSVDLLARTLYGETENDSQSRVAVAYVVMNRKNYKGKPFANQNTVEDVVLYKGAFSCFWDSNLAKCLAPDTSSAVWKNCVNVASNLSSFSNPIGDKRYYTRTDLFSSLSETRNGKLWYKMPGATVDEVEVTSKIAHGKHTFFNIVEP
jgi:hypothetical protein